MNDATVLLVDSRPEAQAHVRDLIGNLVADVVTASGLAEALTVAGAVAPDAVVVGSLVPDGAALELLQRLDAEEASLGCALVAMVDVAGERRALRAGACAFLSPWPGGDETRRTLLALLDDSASRLRLQRALSALRSGDFASAALGLRAASECAPSSLLSSWAQYFLAQVESAQGHDQAAFEELDALLVDEPGFWRAHERLAQVLSKAGATTAAAEHAERARRLRPSVGPGQPVPAAPAARAAVALADSAEDDSDARQTILLADDSELALDMLSRLLEAEGFRVLTAGSGAAALELARRTRPDLLILDGTLPGRSGWEVCEEVKQRLYPEHPPRVLLLSPGHAVKGRWHADEVVSRPFIDEAFVASVRRHLA